MKITKKLFFDKHEREDIVWYRKTFLNEMKLLLPYFVEFSNDAFILTKKSHKNCAMSGFSLEVSYYNYI